MRLIFSGSYIKCNKERQLEHSSLAGDHAKTMDNIENAKRGHGSVEIDQFDGLYNPLNGVCEPLPSDGHSHGR